MTWRVFPVVVGLVGCGRVGFDLAPTADAVDVRPSVSCEMLAPTCGPMGDASCCDSPTVVGGTFYRGYDVAADLEFTDMSHPATVSNFRLDTYEVTVGRFRKFVAAGQGTQAAPPAAGAGARTLDGMAGQGGWDPTWNAELTADPTTLIAALKCSPTYQTWTDAPGANESRPMVCITWYEAMAFCAWDGGYLPTETESMYAAGGGAVQRPYPWSNPASSTSIDCTVANYGGASWPTTACIAAGVSNVGSVSPQGDGMWGQADLGGNVWEWALDWYASPLPMPCNDCANLTAASDRVIRGGGCGSTQSLLRGADRSFDVPSDRGDSLGVRCARAP